MSNYVPLIMFCLATSITPGPNNMLLLISALNYGIKRSFPQFIGIGIGFAMMLLIVGIGFGELIKSSPLIYNIIKYLGVIYLLYLSLKMILSNSAISQQSLNHPVGLWATILFQWANPKVWVMVIGAISAFTRPDQDMWWQIAKITGVYLLIMYPSIALWMCGGKIFSYILKTPTQVKVFNVVMGIMLLSSIVLIIFE